MSCDPLYDDILTGAVSPSELTADQLVKLWRCITLEERSLLQFLISSQGSLSGGGEAVITSGTTNTVPAGAHLVIVQKTNSGDSTDVEGQTLATQWDSIPLPAPPGKTLPEITITPTGASTHAWTRIE